MKSDCYVSSTGLGSVGVGGVGKIFQIQNQSIAEKTAALHLYFSKQNKILQTFLYYDLQASKSNNPKVGILGENSRADL